MAACRQSQLAEEVADDHAAECITEALRGFSFYVLFCSNPPPPPSPYLPCIRRSRVANAFTVRPQNVPRELLLLPILAMNIIFALWTTI